MPSSPNYIRDYKQEAAIESESRKRDRIMRKRARRAFENALGREIPKGMDVDHKVPLSKGGAGVKRANLQLQKASANRSYPRTKTGAMRGRRD